MDFLMRRWLRFLAIGLFAVLALTGQRSHAQTPESTPPRPADAVDRGSQLIKALAEKTNALGACNAELGPLQQLSAQVMTGQLQTPGATFTALKTLVEKKNPGKTIDATGAILDLPAKKKTPDGGGR